MASGTVSERIRTAMEAMGRKVTQGEIARACGVKQPSVHGWLSGGDVEIKGNNLTRLARFLGVNADWLASGRGLMYPEPVHGSFQVRDDSGVARHEIPLYHAPRSSNSGQGELEAMDRTIVKDAYWLAARSANAEDLFAIIADGDANADFIVHGDLVIFDRSKTQPESGAFFLVRHPDGPKIKRLRREFDGGWLLETSSSDKQRHPDERLPAGTNIEAKLIGRLVSRESWG